MSDLREELGQTARDYRIDSVIADEVATECEDRVARIEQSMAQTDRISDEELPSIGLGTLTNQEREIYLGQFSEGLISAAITRTLITRVVDDLQDGLKAGGVAGYREAVESSLGFHPVFRFCVMLHRRLGLTGPLAAQLAYRFEMLRAAQATVHELIDYNHETIAALFDEPTAEELDGLLRWRFDRTWQSLDQLRTRYPEYAETVQKRHLGRVALRLEDRSYRRMLDDQVLSQELFNRLEHDLDKRARVLNRQPRLDLRLEPAALVAKTPYFAELDERRIGMIVSALKTHLAFPGERILRRGDVGSAMYFIASGTVEVATVPKPTRLEGGEFFGAIALITKEPRKADVVAVDYCHLLVLGLRDFERVLDAHPNLREIVHRTALERLGTWFGEK